jgi:hypothetical protein
VVRWVRDPTGKFPQRPHYDPAELDAECEHFITTFLKDRHGSVRFPIDTDDIAVLIEREAEGLDLYADLSLEGDGVQGVTDFRINGRPLVRISKDLSLQTHRRNRLRTTLTHELGHVRFHNFLWSLGQTKLSGRALREASPRCHRNSILGATESDWMEWQAGYASGSFLMPLAALRSVVLRYRQGGAEFEPIYVETDPGQALLSAVQDQFDVSADAAKVRLLKLGYMADGEPSASLFDVIKRR